jgi:glutathione synthase/RimK-type ligase-like ATP-grasp enzyme
MVRLKGVRGLKDCDCIVGTLITSGRGGLNAYREKAKLAKKEGIALVSIEQSKENLKNIRDGELLQCRYWDGVSMIETEAPIPHSCYDRVDIKSKGRRLAESMLYSLAERGTLFVNSPDFRTLCADKWSLYNALAREDVKMPQTFLYSGEGLKQLLEGGELIFVKKRIASQGRGQFVISPGENGLEVLSDEGPPVAVGNLGNLISYFDSRGVTGEEYIAQEGIKTDTLEGRVYDFRVLFQRGRGGRMGMTTFYVRVAAPNSKQSNIGKRGHPQDPFVVFEDYKTLKSELLSSGRKVVNSLSKAYVVGEVGLDFVMNGAGDLFVLEANSKPASKGLRTLSEWVPTDEDCTRKKVIPFAYTNKIRRLWGQRFLNFLNKPLLYSQYLHNLKE